MKYLLIMHSYIKAEFYFIGIFRLFGLSRK